MAFEPSRRRTSLLAALVIMLSATFLVAPAQASGTYSNATIADKALGHVGEVYGECWTFVRDMIYQASNGTQDISAAAGGNDYFDHLANAGGDQVTSVGSLSKGDVVQEGQYGGHTYIIVGHVSGSTFDVVDANHGYDYKVMHYNRTVNLGSNVHAYRFGAVRSDSAPSPWHGVATYRYFGADRLTSGQQMDRGEYITSGNVQFALVLQSDSNLVLYHGSRPIWDSHTHGTGANRLVMQTDGNLVLYKGSTPVWNTETEGNGPSYAVLQTDGNFAVYRDSGGAAAWNSGTSGYGTFSYSGTDRLTSGRILRLNQYLRSADNRYVLLLQGDGNLVLYGPGYHVLWSSGTSGTGADRLVMQGDGNLVLYGGSAPVWNTETNGKGSSYAVLQTDGNFAVYAANGSWTWQSKTHGKI